MLVLVKIEKSAFSALFSYESKRYTNLFVASLNIYHRLGAQLNERPWVHERQQPTIRNIKPVCRRWCVFLSLQKKIS